MKALKQFLIARLSRVIFAWFALSVAATFLLTAAALGALYLVGFDNHFQRQHQRASAYFSLRLKDITDDKSAVQEELDALREFGVTATFINNDGVPVASAGPECSWKTFHFELVSSAGKPVGTLKICDPNAGPKKGFFFVLTLLLLTLWIASAMIARRIAKPLDQLRDASRSFGNGDLTVRAPITGTNDEIAEVALAFNEMAARIEKQFADNNALLAEVSHELRTPLGHLRVLTELLRESCDDSRHLEQIEREIGEIDTLVEQLLAKSRIAFHMTRHERLLPAELAIDAVERTDTPVELLEVGEDVVEIDGDPMLLGAALANLLRNANTHGGGVTRFVVEKRGNLIAFVVEDQGDGLDADDIHLFEAFVQGNGETNHGLGLGLALVHRIVDAHRGKMIVESNDHGTRLGFSLPVSRSVRRTQ